jgi:hypothetical protein
MNPNGEIIKVRLGIEFFVSVSNLPSTSTSHVDNSTSIICSELWVLLTKNQDFWKPKSGITIAWVFYAWMTFSPLEVSSNSISISQVEHLKCVVCYPLTPNTRQNFFLINYRSANGILAL